MPRVTCGKCARELEFSGDPPRFCAYCGQSLGDRPAATTERSTSDTATVERPGLIGGAGAETIDFVPRTRPAEASEVPERVKGYRLIRQLGKGGMGTVYEAEDSRHGRRVAIKIIAPGYVDSESSVERFRREGRLASTLAHPRCVFVLEADEADDGRPFIAMELMTGDTLQDLVEKQGPLEVGDAVGKILDVIEGLTEAHRLGLIHRDVKPSNCFLDGDGRVKVGDFGLSKSRVGSASHLTRTGSFLGTPLYASPEQIKVEPLDVRTDVYSTAATLFFLLTGRAPFDRGDASATMARIVTEPAPSARDKRPEVPGGLDRAIRKGLERDRDRRSRDLGEFVESLRPFAPGHAPSPTLALRFGAYLADYAITGAAMLGLSLSFNPSPWAKLALNSGLTLAYFGVSEGVFGASIGKRFLRMKVAGASGREGAGPPRATLRALVFLALADLPINAFLDLDMAMASLRQLAVLSLGCLAAEAVGLTLIFWPIRRSDERRGLHELASGTRVVGLARGDRRRAAGPRRALGRDRGGVSRPIGVMQAVGPYKVRGAVRWEPNRRVVAGEDSTLGREAWIVIRPKGSPAPEAARREVSRATRPRWLAGGEQHEGRWDAYVAPAGCPIADLAGPEGLPWHDARPILEDLADELAAACAEGTLPPGLTVDQVWVQPDGGAILVDPLAIADVPSAPTGRQTDDERGLALLRRVAALALEGGRRRLDDHSPVIRSPVPLHASELLGRLCGGKDAHATVAAFRSEIQATRNLPTEVTGSQRATQLGILGLFVTAGLISMFILVYMLLIGKSVVAGIGVRSASGESSLPASARFYLALGYCSSWPVIWMVWDAVTRGGISLKLVGLGLVRRDGRAAPRWRAGWRSFLVWAPPASLLIAAVGVQARMPIPEWPCWIVYGLAVALLPLSVASALISPSCGPHDRLSGLRVVPR